MKALKKRLYQFIHAKLAKVQRNIDEQIPKYDLQQKHISNLKVIQNRNKLLEFLPKNGIVAELGVNKGEFSREIFEICDPEKLHLIDIWESERYHDGLRLGIESDFKKEIEKGRIIINRGYSTDLASIFPDHYFDWIYIDTDHSYLITKQELQAYKNKIKHGGIIAGHDYIQGNWGKILRYGVMEAVHEFCVEEDWELLFLTTEMSNSASFAIRKI